MAALATVALKLIFQSKWGKQVAGKWLWASGEEALDGELLGRFAQEAALRNRGVWDSWWTSRGNLLKAQCYSSQQKSTSDSSGKAYHEVTVVAAR